MVYEVKTTPRDIADLFRSFHNAPDYATRQRRMETAELPSGSRIELKVDRSETMDQDRLCLPKDMALSIDKVWGLVVSLRPENSSANTNSPACAQVLLRFPYWEEKAYGYRSVFVRVNAFFADFAPVQPDKLDWTLTRGDIVCGLVQKPLIPRFHKVCCKPFPFLEVGQLNFLFYDH